MGNNGVANFAGPVPNDVLIGDGLTNPEGAEIHLVLRYHGPKIQGHVDEQIHTFAGGCSHDSLIVHLVKVWASMTGSIVSMYSLLSIHKYLCFMQAVEMA